MKFIKTYKIFESKDNLIEDIKDLLIDISDDEYENISVNEYTSETSEIFIIRVVLYSDKTMCIQDYRYDFKRFYRFIKENKFEIGVYYVPVGNHRQIEGEDFNEFINKNIEVRNLLFKITRKIL